MPKLTSVRGLAICMYFNDHPPPHFHVRNRDVKMKIEILTGAIVSSNERITNAALKEVASWLDVNRDSLMAAWNNASEGQSLDWEE